MQTTRQVANEATGYAGPLADGHWLYAATLQAGDRLLNADGTWAKVLGAETVNAPLLAYNLTVEGFHTYFVAANEDAAPVWVHNSCINGKTTLLDGTEIDIQISDQRIKHVLEGNSGRNASGGHSTNSGNVKTVGHVEIGFGGVRRAQVEIGGVLKSNNGGISTLFPETWSDQRILGARCQQDIAYGQEPLQPKETSRDRIVDRMKRGQSLGGVHQMAVLLVARRIIEETKRRASVEIIRITSARHAIQRERTPYEQETR